VHKVLAGIVMQEDLPPAARIAAGRELLDRGWGKALQKVELEGDRTLQIAKIVNYIVDPKDPVSPIQIIGLNGEALPGLEPGEVPLVPEPGETETDTDTP
jgi:hypothetical protein